MRLAPCFLQMDKDGIMKNDLSKTITGLQHIGIPTKDIKATIEFYEGLGFDVAFQTADKTVGGEVAFLKRGALIIETYEGNAAMADGAVDHVSLDVSDIDAAFCAAKDGGYEMLDDAVQSLPFWEHGVRFFTIRGPNREKVEFCQKL